ncbi:hypothetical protein LTR85_006270 [Meristemomyces frigidus]|nr:hypothetical protein LTR85_006270 [Meristemomyces frigidus]
MVTVWLDLDPAISKVVFGIITGLSTFLREQYGSAVNGYNMNEEHLRYLHTQASLGHDFCDSSHIKCSNVLSALAALFNNPWFRRVWVIQEICKADANAIVIAQPHLSLRFADLMVGYRYKAARHTTIVLPEMPSLWYDLVSQLSEPSGRMNWNTGPDGIVAAPSRQVAMDRLQPSRTFANILTLFSRGLPFQATNPRDKLFALLGLALETCVPINIPPELSISYDKSSANVFLDFTWYCLRRYQDLRVFEGVKRTARREFYTDHPCILPASFDFPPEGYPTWAVWHACKEVWTADVGHPPRYSNRWITKYLFLDATLLDIDPNPLHLPLCGQYLDEVDRVIQTPSTERSDDIAFVATPSTPRALHTLWRQLLEDFRSHSSNTESGQQSSLAYATDADLFDQLLYTVICDAPLHNLGDKRHGLDQDPRERTHLSQDATMMEYILSYWLQGISDDPDMQRKFLIDSELPPDAMKTCGHLIEARRVSARSGMLFEATLHHVLGQCFFITRKGLIGLGPVGTQSGDWLVALRGAPLASVLRSQPGEGIEWSINGLGWRFVGESYVHAWMDGRFVEQMVANGQELDELYVLV